TTPHPGTSGRSPPPPTHNSSFYRNRLASSGVRGRLSYGSHGGTTAALSPPSTDASHGGGGDASAFLAALSPSTARYLASRKEEGGESEDVVRSSNGEEPPQRGDGARREGHARHLLRIGQDEETVQLRCFVQSLLGIKLPHCNRNNNSDSSSGSHVTIMSTPDPATASFYALALLAKTHRPDDAYLAARALSLKGESKRAIWILDRAGLIGAVRWKEGDGEGDDAAGFGGLEQFNHVADDVNGRIEEDVPYFTNISNGEGIRNALLLRSEAALLAGQCLVAVGEHDRAIAVYEEAMRFPPPPPPMEWGYYGYGYRVHTDAMEEDDDNKEGEGGLESKFADEMYIRQWREQSLSHTALIDEGDDQRLLRLAENICPLHFSSDNIHTQKSPPMTTDGIHPLARLCTARGIAYDEISNPHRALPFLRIALDIDARCIEALDYVIKKRLLTPQEEKEWVASLNWGDRSTLGSMGISWLRDLYLVRVRGGMGGTGSPPSTVQDSGHHEHGAINESFKSLDVGRVLGASSILGVGLQTPSTFSVGSPSHPAGVDSKKLPWKLDEAASDTADEAFRNLAMTHHLGKSSDVLSLAAIRSYASHNLQAALTYCSVIDTLDPFCRTAGYVYVATLVGLGLKRRLFQLAHRLVDADPKDALAWFAVGSYYHLCRRHDLSQRYFSRSTRLDPSSAECWIGFGCSFAACDESDQALASFRAAQNKYSGSHIPLLYMGMEYLRTNHLSLAGHFLASSQKTDASDPLCCNELGVWSFRRGDLEDAAFWFVKALRLHIEAESSSLTSTDAALGTNGYVLLNSNAKKDPTDDSHRKDKPDAETPGFKGQHIASYESSNEVMDRNLTDIECVHRCNDIFWEPTIYNLGQSYRKLRRYVDAIVCFEKCSSLNPGSSSAFSALGFAHHLNGDVDRAIDSYHEALSRKPDDPFSTEMLNRALSEAVTYPKSSVFDSDMFTSEVMRQTSVIGRSILPAKPESFKAEMGVI
ncbi:hypothetical protein HJC23_011259, partial [Cyclotella cryptica]